MTPAEMNAIQAQIMQTYETLSNEIIREMFQVLVESEDRIEKQLSQQAQSDSLQLQSSQNKVPPGA